MRASTAPRNTVARATTVKVTAEEEVERLRLNNLKPLPGSRRKEQRKGRGRAAGQVRTRLRPPGIRSRSTHQMQWGASWRRGPCRQGHRLRAAMAIRKHQHR